MDALTSALGAAQISTLEEAGVLEYIAGVLDPTESDDDLREIIAPLLLDAAVAEDDDGAAALCDAVLRALRGDGGGDSTPAADAPLQLLGGPVSMATLVKADAQEEDAHVKEELGPVRVTVNSMDLNTKKPVNSLIDDDADEAAIARRWKAAKRAEKRLKRDTRRERALNMQREEFMRELTREPVVLHWKGGGGGGNGDIHLRGAQMDINGLALLDDCNLTLVSGRKYGLVGRNGIGKTTLLKFLAAHRFEGMPPQLQVLHIEQEVAGGELSVLETVLATDIERNALLAEQAELEAEAGEVKAEGSSAGEGSGCAAVPAVKDEEDLRDEAERQQRLLEVYDRLQEIDADTAPARAGAILSGLGFDDAAQARPTASFSGGWRMRVSLARALFVEPDVLLLDEPTNHLDLHAVLWLEEYLEGWDKTTVVVSHARAFLNRVCTDILHFQEKQIKRYKGDYDTFEEVRAEALRNSERHRESAEKHREHMQAFVDKFRSNAKRAAMVQSRIKAIARMEVVAETLADPTLCFDFPPPEPLSGLPILQLADVGFNYPGQPNLFKNVNLGVDLNSRVALVGPNGIGKSTLLKLVLGDLEPVAGAVHRHGKLRLGRFSQHHVDQLDLSLTALEHFSRCWPQAKPLEIRAHLGTMGMGGNLSLQKMSTLSGGQKSRVAFAQIMWQKPHLLLLDEPTNHLDLDAVEALIQALLSFDGGLLVVSHDEHLVSSICEELWVAEPGKVSIFRNPDTSRPAFEAYRKLQLKKKPAPASGAPPKKS